MKSALWTVGIAVVVGLTLQGCGSSSGGAVTREFWGEAVPSRVAMKDMNVTVATDKSTYKTGEEIRITVNAKNTSSSPASLGYTNGGEVTKWGYIIAKEGKIVAYEYWSGHRSMFTAVMAKDVYAAGETRTFGYVFPFLPNGADDTLPVRSLSPGTYQVFARHPEFHYDSQNRPVKTNSPTPASDPVTITVTP